MYYPICIKLSCLERVEGETMRRQRSPYRRGGPVRPSYTQPAQEWSSTFTESFEAGKSSRVVLSRDDYTNAYKLDLRSASCTGGQFVMAKVKLDQDYEKMFQACDSEEGEVCTDPSLMILLRPIKSDSDREAAVREFDFAKTAASYNIGPKVVYTCDNVHLERQTDTPLVYAIMIVEYWPYTLATLFDDLGSVSERTKQQILSLLQRAFQTLHHKAKMIHGGLNFNRILLKLGTHDREDQLCFTNFYRAFIRTEDVDERVYREMSLQSF